MSTAIVQSESEEKLQTVLDYTQKMGISFQRLSSFSTSIDSVQKNIFLQGGDGKSIPDPEHWLSKVREDRF